jgi:ABC-type Fe3+/spermidine/putrescine transport system ATPase subunit
MSDRIVVMDAGQIVQTGTPQAIYREPTSAFVADFVGETNLLEGTVSSATAGMVQIGVGSGFSVSAAADAHVGAEVTVTIRPEHLRLNADVPHYGNSWDATVVGAAYAGSSIRYVVEISEIRVVVRVDSLAATSGLTIGEKVRVSVDPASVRVLAPGTNRSS